LLLFVALLALFFSIGETKKVKKEKKRVEAAVHQEEIHDVPFSHSSFARPRQLMRQTKYEKCKAECARIKEQEDMHTYLTQLREELAAAEAMIADVEMQSQSVYSAEAARRIEELQEEPTELDAEEVMEEPEAPLN
ncbi:hypothetical protein PMAYCL1PPCAC_23134, partial [Pristionchus mayeri]